MKPTLMPSPSCATEQILFFFPHQDLQKQKVQAGIIIFVNVPTTDINPQKLNWARQMDFKVYFKRAGSFFTRQEDLISTLYQCIWTSLSTFLGFLIR